jgi:hypothetical protein
MTIIFFPNIGLSVGLDYMPAEDESTGRVNVTFVNL